MATVWCSLNFIILSSTVFDSSTCETDGQTAGW